MKNHIQREHVHVFILLFIIFIMWRVMFECERITYDVVSTHYYALNGFATIYFLFDR